MGREVSASGITISSSFAMADRSISLRCFSVLSKIIYHCRVVRLLAMSASILQCIGDMCI